MVRTPGLAMSRQIRSACGHELAGLAHQADLARRLQLRGIAKKIFEHDSGLPVAGCRQSWRTVSSIAPTPALRAAALAERIVSLSRSALRIVSPEQLPQRRRPALVVVDQVVAAGAPAPASRRTTSSSSDLEVRCTAARGRGYCLPQHPSKATRLGQRARVAVHDEPRRPVGAGGTARRPGR